MAKSIKLKNENYWDSSAISHNHEKLSYILSNLMGKGLSNTDFNNMQTTGVYYMGTGCSNCPTSGYVYLFVMKASENDITQIGLDVSTNKMYTRTKVNGTWGSWQKITSEETFSRTYSNTTYKYGYLEMYKVGRIVYFYCVGDFCYVPSGDTEYISWIDPNFRPVSGQHYAQSWNNKSYIYLRFDGSTDKVYIGNYSGDISQATNGAFCGSYISAW